MSIAILARVWQSYPAAGCKRDLLMFLADQANDYGFVIDVPVAKMMQRLRINKRNTQKHLSTLRNEGMLREWPRRGYGSTYRVRWGAPPMSPEQEDAYLRDPDTWDRERDVAEDMGTPVTGDMGSRARSSFQSKTKNQEKPSEDTPRTRARTPRDDLWDAVTAVCQIDAATLTAGEKSRVGRSVNELLAVGATPLEVQARAVRYRQKYEGAALTDRALVNHWSEFSGRRIRSGLTEQNCPECDLPMSAKKLRDHRYAVHDVGRACPDCAEVVLPEEEHQCSAQG